MIFKRTQTIKFNDFMDGSWKKPKVINVLPAVAFVPNEPTTFLVTMLGVGLVVLIVEHLVQEKDYADFIRIFRERYLKYAFPTCVVITGVYVFFEIVDILL